MTTAHYLTPQQTAERIGVSVHSVLTWIAGGELAAHNVGRNPRGGKPRWRIAPEALEAFLAARGNRKPEPAKARRRKRAGRSWIV